MPKNNLKRKRMININIKCMLDKELYKEKPTGWKVGRIQNNLANAQVEISVEELAEYLCNGATFKPALLNGKKSEDWISQQVFALDFDGGSTINNEIERCKQLNIQPAFGYTSFSHTVEKHKFRLVFIADSVITDRELRDKLQITLIKTFSKSDQVTFNADRLFFGGREMIEFDFTNRINTEDIISRFYKDDYIETNNKSSSSSKVKVKVKVKVKDIASIKTTDNTDSKGNSGYDFSKQHIKSIQNLDFSALQTLMALRLRGGEVFGVEKEEEYISSSISTPKTLPIVCPTLTRVYEVINSINMYDFLGIDDSNFFSCILPSHDDSTPSAHIITAADGTHLYKCFGCADNKGISLVTLVTKIANCSRKKAIDFIKNVYNIHLLQSEWQIEVIDEIKYIKDYIYSNEFEEEYPNLHKRLKNKLNKFNAFLDVAIKNVYDENKLDNKPVFFIGEKELFRIFQTSSPESVSKTINLFALLKIIEKLPEKKIPEEMLKKAKHYSASKGYKKLPNHYLISDFGCSLEQSEQIAIKLVKNNFSIKGLGREWTLRTFGTELADEIYPQFKFENQKGTTKKSDKRTNDIVKVIFDCIDQKGYATKKEVIKILRRKYGKTKTEVQIERSLQEILDGYGLQKVRANNQIKEQYGITGNGYPFLILKLN